MFPGRLNNFFIESYEKYYGIFYRFFGLKEKTWFRNANQHLTKPPGSELKSQRTNHNNKAVVFKSEATVWRMKLESKEWSRSEERSSG